MSNDHYAAVIADLERKRAEIDNLIESLKAFGGGEISAKPESVSTLQRAHSNEFANMSMADAAKLVIERAGRPLGNAEILEGLEAGGLISRSENKLNTLGSVLNRRAHEERDIVRVGRGMWSTYEIEAKDVLNKPSFQEGIKDLSL
jgi:hypothetical protein